MSRKQFAMLVTVVALILFVLPSTGLPQVIKAACSLSASANKNIVNFSPSNEQVNFGHNGIVGTGFYHYPYTEGGVVTYRAFLVSDPSCYVDIVIDDTGGSGNGGNDQPQPVAQKQVKEWMCKERSLSFVNNTASFAMKVDSDASNSPLNIFWDYPNDMTNPPRAGDAKVYASKDYADGEHHMRVETTSGDLCFEREFVIKNGKLVTDKVDANQTPQPKEEPKPVENAVVAVQKPSKDLELFQRLDGYWVIRLPQGGFRFLGICGPTATFNADKTLVSYVDIDGRADTMNNRGGKAKTAACKANDLAKKATKP